MREQGSAGLGLTVSRKFATQEEADEAVKELRSAGFREEEIRVWQHKKLEPDYEDRLARTVEGIMGGGVIGALIGLFFTTAYNFKENTKIVNETTPGAILVSAIIGAVLLAIIVNIVSARYAFNRHPAHSTVPPTVVTVRVGEKEAQAKQVFAHAAHD